MKTSIEGDRSFDVSSPILACNLGSHRSTSNTSDRSKLPMGRSPMVWATMGMLAAVGKTSATPFGVYNCSAARRSANCLNSAQAACMQSAGTKTGPPFAPSATGRGANFVRGQLADPASCHTEV